MSSRSWTESAAPDSDESLITVGRIRRAHGVGGAVLIDVLSDYPERFQTGARLILKSPRTDRVVRVRAARPHAGGLLLELEEIGDRDAADEVAGCPLVVPAGESPPAPAGSWYAHQLVGCRCIDRRLGELGRVSTLVESGGGVLLQITGEDGSLLVPFVRRFLVEVDPTAERIELDLPAGLRESCASAS